MTDVALILGIDAREAKQGADEAKRAMDGVKGKAREAESSVDKLGKSLKGLGSDLFSLKSIVATALAAFSFKRIIEETAKAERAAAQLNAALRSTGNAVGYSASQLEVMAKALQRVGVEGDDAILQMQSVLLTFTNIRGKVFGEATKSILDLSARLGTDLQGAAIQVGKALQNPIQGLSALQRVGVSFTESQKELVKQLIATGKGAEAQKLILQELQKEFGGSAEAARGTLGGSLKALGEQFGDLLETIGGVLNSGGRMVNFFETIGLAIEAASDKVKALSGDIKDLSQSGLAEQIVSITKKINATQAALNDLNNSSFPLAKSRSSFGLFTRDGQIKIENDTLAAQLKTKDELVNQLEELKEREKKATEPEATGTPVFGPSDEEISNLKDLIKNRKEALALADVELDQKKRLYEATQISQEAADAMADTIERENALREVKLDLGSKEGKQLDALLKKQQEYERATDAITEARKKEIEAAKEAAEKASEELARPFQNAMDDIQRSFVDGFEKVFTGQIKKFSDFADIVKGIFIKLAAEIAALMVFRPSLVSAAGGVGAIASGALSGSAPQLNANSFGIGDLASVGSFFGKSGFNGITESINAWGASNLGLANVPSNFVGPLLPGQTAGLTLGGALSGAGIGALIGGLNLFGGNSTGSTIGGTIGGLAGNFIPVPVLGPIIGSAIGSAIGGLFGGGKPHPQAGFSGVVNDAGGFDSLHLGAKHLSIADAQKYQDLLGPIVASLVSSGVDLAGKVVSAGVFDGKGFFAPDVRGNDSPDKITYDANKQESATNALNKFVVELTKMSNTLNDDILKALPNITTEGRKTEEVLSDIAFALNFDKLGQKPEEISAVDEAMKALKETFDKAAETAKRLGLEEAKVEAARQTALNELRSGFNKTVLDDYLSIADPMTLAVLQEQERYTKQLTDAQKIGADMTLVEALHKERLSQIQSQYNSELQNEMTSKEGLVSQFRSISDRIGATLNSLRFGSLSPLSPQTRYDELRALFLSTSNAARLGDVSAGESLPDIAQQFLQASQGFYASSEQYSRDFDLVQNSLKSTKSVADRQLSVLQEQLEQLKKIASGAAGLAPLSASQDAVSLYKSGKISYAQFANEITGYSGPSGQGQRAAWLESHPAEKAKLSAARILAGLPGFAAGGITPTNMPFWVGERGPELMAPMSQAFRVIPNNRISANDNSAVARAMNAMAAEFNAYRTQSANQTKALETRLDQLVAANQETARKIQRVASK